MQRDRVRGRQQLFEFEQLDTLGGRRVGIGADHLDSERPGPAGEGRADPAEADDPEALGVESAQLHRADPSRPDRTAAPSVHSSRHPARMQASA